MTNELWFSTTSLSLKWAFVSCSNSPRKTGGWWQDRRLTERLCDFADRAGGSVFATCVIKGCNQESGGNVGHRTTLVHVVVLVIVYSFRLIRVWPRSCLGTQPDRAPHSRLSWFAIFDRKTVKPWFDKVPWSVIWLFSYRETTVKSPL